MYFLCFDSEKRLNLTSAGRFVSYEGHIHPRRKLQQAVLLLGFEGCCPIAQDGREYLLKRGSFQLLFPNHTHYGIKKTVGAQSHFWCHFSLPKDFFIAEADTADELREEGLCVLPEFSQVDDCERYFVLFSQLIDEFEKLFEGEKLGGVICDSYLKILLCSLSDNCAEVGGKRHIISTKIREWLQTNHDKEPSVSEVAKALNYNPHYLTKLVKGETGMTFVRYINFLKLNKAKNLLINSNIKISEVALLSGFADEKYFMRVFHKHEKLTPKQYRLAYFRKNINKE